MEPISFIHNENPNAFCSMRPGLASWPTTNLPGTTVPSLATGTTDCLTLLFSCDAHLCWARPDGHFYNIIMTSRDRSRHANGVTPARYSRREYIPDRNPRSRTLSCTGTMTWLRHRTSLAVQTNDRRASVVHRS
jgi:hypothetical protein